MPNVIVKGSKIHGKGVFAGRNFKKGKVIMKWDTSMVFSEAEADSLPKRFWKYLVFSKGKYILAQVPEKYLNHSCRPNTKEIDNCDVALRNIRKGEELTTDYSLDAPPQVKMKCACKSRKCKRVI